MHGQHLFASIANSSCHNQRLEPLLCLPSCQLQCSGTRQQPAPASPGSLLLASLSIALLVIGLARRSRASRRFRASAHASRARALARWVESEGGFVGDVACGERDGVRGLYATKDVPKGTLLLSVPEACCIAADEDPQWGLSLRELATARLVGSLSRGERKVYMRTCCPKRRALLVDWSDAELAELQSPRLAEVARGPMAPFLDESVARVLPFVQGTEADVRWAERMVRSRALCSMTAALTLSETSTRRQ